VRLKTRGGRIGPHSILVDLFQDPLQLIVHRVSLFAKNINHKPLPSALPLERGRESAHIGVEALAGFFR
jgi:hypothetical protein